MSFACKEVLAQYERLDNLKEADEGRLHGAFLVVMKNSRQPETDFDVL